MHAGVLSLNVGYSIPLPKPISMEVNIKDNSSFFEKISIYYIVTPGIKKQSESIQISVLMTTIGMT